jgi:hypothetical protein
MVIRKIQRYIGMLIFYYYYLRQQCQPYYLRSPNEKRGINMKFHISSYLFLCFMALFMSGCATTTSFQYDYPQANKPALSKLRIACTPPKDERQPNEDVDKIWSRDPVQEVGTIIQEEIRSTGLFSEVISIPKEDKAKRADIQMVLHTSLKELSWEIPNLEEQVAATLAISILTGGIGGLVYGSGNTDFYGNARLRVVLEDQQTGKRLLDKKYSSRAEEKMARLKTDSAEERARIIGKAVKQVMEQLKTDLEQVVKNENPQALSKQSSKNLLL